MEFSCFGTKDGGLDFGERGRMSLRHYILDNPGVRFTLKAVLPESSSQRRYFEGAIVPLVAFFQEGMSHKNPDDLRRVREWLKAEFNGELVVIGGKPQKVGMSTKGREALQRMIERVVDWLVENYAPPPEALDPDYYKRWRDTVLPYGGPDNYIDYMDELTLLPKR